MEKVTSGPSEPQDPEVSGVAGPLCDGPRDDVVLPEHGVGPGRPHYLCGAADRL